MLIRHLILIVPAGAIVLSVANIGEGAELPTELINCRALSSSVARLDCYDQLIDAQTAAPNQTAKRQTAENPPPVAPAAATATVESDPKLSQENLFGKNEAGIRESVQEATGTKEIEQLEATVTEVRKMKSGKVLITLDNGQVWMQTDGSRARLSSNDSVTIERASFGSYMLHVKNTAMRVKRIS